MNTNYPLTLPDEVSAQIVREDLIQLMDMGVCRPLVLLIGPSGCGKSTLIHQWLDSPDHLFRNELTVRYKLTSQHNTEHHFIDGLYRALSDQGLEALPSIDNETQHDGFSIDRFGAKQLLSVLPNNQKKLNLVLENFEFIRSRQINEWIKNLAEKLPRGISIILSSRRHPDFCLRQLKRLQRVLVIDEHDLKINSKELMQLNQSLALPALSQQDVVRILDRTDRWFSGAKLALISRKSDPAVLSQSVDELPSEQSDKLVDFFAAEALIKLPEDTKIIVLKLSIFNEFDNELAASVLGEVDTETYIAELIRHGLLSHCAVDDSRTYQFQPRLRQFIYEVLEGCKSVEYIQCLHLSAAKHCFDQGLNEKGLYHAIESKDVEFYFNSLDVVTDQWLRNGDCDLIIKYLSELDSKVISGKLTLLVRLITSLLLSRRFSQAKYYLEWIEAHHKRVSHKDTRRAYAGFLGEIVKNMTSEAIGLDHRFSLTALSPDTRSYIKTIALLLDAYALFLNGQTNEAINYAEQAHEQFGVLGQPFLQSYAQLLLAQSHLLQCNYSDVSFYFKALANASIVTSSNGYVRKNLYWINSASVKFIGEYQANLFDQAKESAKHFIPEINYTCVSEHIVRVYIYKARIEADSGQYKDANRSLDQIERMLSLGDYPRLECKYIQEKVRQSLVYGYEDMDEISQRFDLSDLASKLTRARSKKYSEAEERKILSVVYFLIAKNRLDKAMVLIEKLSDVLKSYRVPMRSLVLQALRIVILDRQGKKEIAAHELNKLINQFSLQGFTRIVFDEAPGLGAVFRYGIFVGRIQKDEGFLDKYSSVVGEIGKEKAPSASVKLQLTSKEQEILELLSAGLTNEQISRSAGISIATTKWHLKNIYQKLGIKNRAAAIKLFLSD